MLTVSAWAGRFVKWCKAPKWKQSSGYLGDAWLTTVDIWACRSVFETLSAEYNAIGELYCAEGDALDPADGMPGIWATFPISVWDVLSLELCKVSV